MRSFARHAADCCKFKLIYVPNVFVVQFGNYVLLRLRCADNYYGRLRIVCSRLVVAFPALHFSLRFVNIPYFNLQENFVLRWRLIIKTDKNIEFKHYVLAKS